MILFILLTVFIRPIFGDDPKDVTIHLGSHLKHGTNRIPRLVRIGDLEFGNVVLKDAYLGDLRTLTVAGKTWFWRKFIWFSVFGDLKLDKMYLAARQITIDGKNHSGVIYVDENQLHFNWEAVDHFRCSLTKELVYWVELNNFRTGNGKLSTSLSPTDYQVLDLKKKLITDDVFRILRDLTLPCLHPRFPITFGWEGHLKFIG